MAREAMVTLSVRIPAGLKDAIRERAEDLQRDQSEIVREAIEAFLEAPTLTVEQRFRAIESRLADLESRVDGD